MGDRNAERLAIFNNMTPEKRDYDRFVARRIPHGASIAPETEAGRRMQADMLNRGIEDRGCSCMYYAPCDFCLSLTEEEANILWNDGMQAMLRHRRQQETAGPTAG